jgi:hypothetical protein
MITQESHPRVLSQLLSTAPDRKGVLSKPEPFVSAEEAAHFLGVKRRFLLSLARRGIAGSYALGTGEIRKIWVFRLSELAAAVDPKTRTQVLYRRSEPDSVMIRSGSPR